MFWVGACEACDGLDIRPLALDDESIRVADSPEYLDSKAPGKAEDLGNHDLPEEGELVEEILGEEPDRGE